MKLPFNWSDKLSISWSDKLAWFKGDRILWIVLIILSIASLLIIYSATGSLAWRNKGGNTSFYVLRHLTFMVIGIGLMLFMINKISVRRYSEWAPLLWCGGIVLLIISFSIKGAGTGRTINLGPIGFQPSEIAKLTTVMFVARLLAANQKSALHRKKAFWQIMIVGGISFLAIFLSDFTTSILLAATVLCMMIVGHIPAKFLLGTIGTGVVILGLLILSAGYLPKSFGRVHTMKNRIERYVGIGKAAEKEKNQGFSQNDFGKLAIYKGGVLGVGPGNSEVSNYMAAAYNDFVFAIFIEEWGIVGAFVLAFFYLIFLYRGGIIMKNSDRTFPAFLVVGFTFMFTGQAMMNMGVATGLLPNTGQPLPWVSYGGTSAIFTAIGFGCILSVSAQSQKNKKSSVVIKSKGVEAPQDDEELK